MTNEITEPYKNIIEIVAQANRPTLDIMQDILDNIEPETLKTVMKSAKRRPLVSGLLSIPPNGSYRFHKASEIIEASKKYDQEASLLVHSFFKDNTLPEAVVEIINSYNKDFGLF